MKIRTFLSIIILAIALSACKKDPSASVAISGKWFQEWSYDDSLVYREVFDFKDDRMLERTTSLSTQKNQLKGYTSREIGRYSFKGDSLIIKNSKYFSSYPDRLKKLEELQYLYTNKHASYQVVYSANKDTLTLRRGCNDGSDCFPNPKLTRITP